MAIANSIIKNLEANNGEFLGLSSVWDIYGCGPLGARKTSNVYKDIQKFTSDKDVKKVWVKGGAKGWSQHSETQVLIFDVSNMTQKDIDNAGIEYKGRFINL